MFSGMYLAMASSILLSAHTMKSRCCLQTAERSEDIDPFYSQVAKQLGAEITFHAIRKHSCDIRLRPELARDTSGGAEVESGTRSHRITRRHDAPRRGN